MMPVMKPTMSLALCERKKDPWPQSWKMMKVRMSRPAASPESASVNQYDTDKLKYMRYHSTP